MEQIEATLSPQLVYDDGEEKPNPVAIGDLIRLPSTGEYFIIDFFRPPHKPASSGKVSIRSYHGYGKPLGASQEVYVGVIGAKWINRNDR